jgi:4-amino-4-deoxy-L-arabinose transferase-like glycosyltransferase
MIAKRSSIIILTLCAVAYLLGMFCVPLMNIDAAQYASISREMLERHSFLQVYDLGKDYLDKPPMLFWLSALSMKLFGIHDWAYRLPSFLFSVLAIYSTYRLALLFYKKEIAILSTLVLATCQALFLINHDVRTDTMLMGWVIFSLWQLAAWYSTKSWLNFFLAFLAIAGGMMTKGPIALMVPAFAFVPHFILRREWKQLFRIEYVLGLLIIAVALVPMSWGLYQQFDIHPGKLINNVPIKSGLKFYYWTQSFGRFTGENYYHENGYFTFLFENMLWSFLPWIIFFLIGLVFDIVGLIQARFKLAQNEEWISTGGFIITYCILARSQAQLPHYIFIVFPLAAIITAKFLYKLTYTDQLVIWRKALTVLHVVIFTAIWGALVALLVIPFASIPKYVGCLAAIGLLAMLYILTMKKTGFPKLLEVAFFTIIGVNIFLNSAFYPTLLKFQIGNTVADVIAKQQLPKDKVRIYGAGNDYTLHFYGNHIFKQKTSIAQLDSSDIILTPKDSVAVVTAKFPASKILYNGRSYGVTQLSIAFLNPATRERVLGKYVVMRLDSTHSLAK